MRGLNSAPIRGDGDYVLYWMIAARRAESNYALDRAVEFAAHLDKPLLVFEPLRIGYAWASARFHRFVIDGMRDNARAFAGMSVMYYPYLEPEPNAGRGLLETLARDACIVVTDDYPAFFLPQMIAAAADKVSVRLDAVDSNGILPMRAANKVFARAYDFRRFLQANLDQYLPQSPLTWGLQPKLRPMKRAFDDVLERWPPATEAILEGADSALSALPIDHTVGPVPYSGGSVAATAALAKFLESGFATYPDRNHPDNDSASGLSPYLHFGHLSAHEVLQGIARVEEWAPHKAATWHSGKRTGWWGMSEAGESFLDQLVTWRELGFNFCANRQDYASYDSLPKWARTTLDEHALDPRPYTYSLEQFEQAETHDEIWNAAQRQLRVEGRIHNYLRMLWGKKILHWTRDPRQALEVMVHLNNKYAVDGRDPNSYSGIFWVLGRYDRAWGPEREIFGKIRYMTSASTRRKLRLNAYLERWQG